MADLTVANSFSAGTTIVSADMNENFTDITGWATGSPNLSVSGSTTTVEGRLDVDEDLYASKTIYLDGTVEQQIVWEGTTVDTYETFLRATDPTSADRIITLPDATGTVALTSTVMPLAGGTFTGAVTFDGASPIVLEGATADAYETTIAVTDPTADRTITLPDATGTVALKDIELNNQTASYTLVLADAGKLVEVNNASANTLTVPPNSSVAFPTGTQIIVVQQGAGATTVTAGAGVTLRSKDSNLAIGGQYASAALIKRATDEWYVTGALA